MSRCTSLSVLIRFTLFLFVFQTACADSHTPELPLANVCKQGIDLNDYWLSEKLDGELWIMRNSFERLMSCA